MHLCKIQYFFYYTLVYCKMFFSVHSLSFSLEGGLNCPRFAFYCRSMIPACRESHHIPGFNLLCSLWLSIRHSGRLKDFFLGVREIFVSATFFTNSHSLLFLPGWDSVQMAFPHPVMDLLKPSRLFRDIRHLAFLSL